MKNKEVTIAKNRFLKHIAGKDFKGFIRETDDLRSTSERVTPEYVISEWKVWSVENMARVRYGLLRENEPRSGMRYWIRIHSGCSLYLYEKIEPYFTAQEVETFLYTCTPKHQWSWPLSRKECARRLRFLVDDHFSFQNLWHIDSLTSLGVDNMIQLLIDKCATDFGLGFVE